MHQFLQYFNNVENHSAEYSLMCMQFMTEVYAQLSNEIVIKLEDKDKEIGRLCLNSLV